MSKLSDGLTAYLKSWHETTVASKTEAGHIVDLPFEDFIGLFKRSHFVSLQKAIDANRLRYMQDVGNAYALVATWRSYAACSSGIYNKHTATICSRTKSAKINLPQAGDKLRPSHCHNISASLIGKEKAPEHRKAISEGCRGVSKAAWSPERRAQRSAQRQAQEAAKKESTND